MSSSALTSRGAQWAASSQRLRYLVGQAPAQAQSEADTAGGAARRDRSRSRSRSRSARNRQPSPQQSPQPSEENDVDTETDGVERKNEVTSEADGAIHRVGSKYSVAETEGGELVEARSAAAASTCCSTVSEQIQQVVEAASQHREEITNIFRRRFGQDALTARLSAYIEGASRCRTWVLVDADDRVLAACTVRVNRYVHKEQCAWAQIMYFGVDSARKRHGLMLMSGVEELLWEERVDIIGLHSVRSAQGFWAAAGMNRGRILLTRRECSAWKKQSDAEGILPLFTKWLVRPYCHPEQQPGADSPRADVCVKNSGAAQTIIMTDAASWRKAPAEVWPAWRLKELAASRVNSDRLKTLTNRQAEGKKDIDQRFGYSIGDLVTCKRVDATMCAPDEVGTVQSFLDDGCSDPVVVLFPNSNESANFHPRELVKQLEKGAALSFGLQAKFIADGLGVSPLVRLSCAEATWLTKGYREVSATVSKNGTRPDLATVLRRTKRAFHIHMPAAISREGAVIGHFTLKVDKNTSTDDRDFCLIWVPGFQTCQLLMWSLSTPSITAQVGLFFNGERYLLEPSCKCGWFDQDAVGYEIRTPRQDLGIVLGVEVLQTAQAVVPVPKERPVLQIAMLQGLWFNDVGWSFAIDNTTVFYSKQNMQSTSQLYGHLEYIPGGYGQLQLRSEYGDGNYKTVEHAFKAHGEPEDKLVFRSMERAKSYTWRRSQLSS